jgi:hypothetical protein
MGYEVQYEHAVYPHGIVRYTMLRKASAGDVVPGTGGVRKL